MLLPVKITPDHIRDAIVQVNFSKSLPFEIFIADCYKLLIEKGWSYQNQYIPQQTQAIPQQTQAIQAMIAQIGQQAQYFFVKDKVRIQFIPSGTLAVVSFNINKEYIGWADYSKEISDVLKVMADNTLFNEIVRVSVRYVNQFVNINIIPNLESIINLTNITGNLIKSAFRMTFEDNGVSKTINIADNLLPIEVGLINHSDAKTVSLIDIDVIKDKISFADFDDVWNCVEELHKKEKEVFFSLLKKDFLSQLNPQY